MSQMILGKFKKLLLSKEKIYSCNQLIQKSIMTISTQKFFAVNLKIYNSAVI